MKIKSVKRIKLESPKPFYDITVEKYHNFSIGDSNIICHNSSLAGAISKLARPFGCSYSILEGDGFFGSPVNPTPSAARYTKVKITSKIKDAIFKNFDLNEKNGEGGHDWLNVEFPIGLLTHVVGIAVGYRSNILPRKYEDIIEYLNGSPKLLKPYFKDFAGKISKFKNEESTWLLESGFEVDTQKKTIHIFDLPPVMRYDSFINKLDQKLENIGVDYRIENKSRSKCELTVSIRGVNQERFSDIAEIVSRLCKIIVKEDVVFVKDGKVAEFDSIKEYLDSFRTQLELVKLKRLEKDLENNENELTFLEAKLMFLNFMIVKKRTNQEIMDFLSQFESWISSKLQKIEMVKLNAEHIKETELAIKAEKQKIVEVKKLIKLQDKKYKEVLEIVKKIQVEKQRRLAMGPLFEMEQIDGIDVFQVIEEEEENNSDQNEEEDEI